MNKVYLGDCLELMKSIEDKSINMINTDLPYQITNCSWDTLIPFNLLWDQYKRIIKDNGAIVLSANQPFTTKLISSNIKMFKYCWVWLKKGASSNFVHAHNMPIKGTEDIVVFSKAPIGHKIQLKEKRMKYNPQGLKKVNILWKRPKKYDSEHKLKRKSHKLKRIIEYTNYPKNIITITNNNNIERGLHPTQKPVALYEYLIKTYTNEGDLVLDSCAGSGTTAIACINTKRNYILMEMNKDYYNIILERIKNPRYTKPKEIKLGMKLIFGKNK